MVVPHEHADDVWFCDQCAGHWAVLSASRTVYLLDLRGRTQTRLPDEMRVDDWLASGGVRLDPLPMPPGMQNDSPGQRRDGEAIRLLKVGECRLGEPLEMTLDLVGNGQHFTTRTTTPVLAVRLLEPVS